MKKRILVTGGSGFIGSHLCEALLNAGHHIICVDNFLTGSEENIADLYDHSNFEILNHDVIKPLYIDVDEIYNLACPASLIHCRKDAIHTLKTSIIGMMNMLGLAKRLNIKILQASTSEVYGDPKVHPQPESYWGNVNTVGIRSCYDEGKRCTETLCYEYHKQHNVRTKIVRIFNTYGPRMQVDDNRVVSNFVVQALKNEDIIVHGDGSQTRSFCYVDDLVSGFISMMDSADNVIGPINLGNPNEFTILELAQKVIHLTGSRSKIVFENLREDDPTRRQPDIHRAQEILNWSPMIQLEDGLLKTIAYFEKILSESMQVTY